MNNSSRPPPSSSPSEAALDTSPLLGHSIADNLLRSRQLIRRTAPPQLRGAARLLRRASGRRMMLREPSVRVRENAAEQLEERQSDWAHSKPVVVLDVLWNLAFVGLGLAVLGLSVKERPVVPLRLWVAGYVAQCLFHVSCVIMEYRKRREARLAESEGIASWENGGDSNSNSGSASDGEDYGIEQRQVEEETRKESDCNFSYAKKEKRGKGNNNGSMLRSSVEDSSRIEKDFKASFSSQIRPMERNSYSYGIAIPLFGCILFKGIVIPMD